MVVAARIGAAMGELAFVHGDASDLRTRCICVGISTNGGRVQMQGIASVVAVGVSGLHIHVHRLAIISQGKGQCAVIIGNLDIAIGGNPGGARV